MASLYALRVHIAALFGGGLVMGDLIFLAIGLGLFTVMGGYIVALRGL